MVGSSATVQKSLCLREMEEEPATTEDKPGVNIALWEQGPPIWSQLQE